MYDRARLASRSESSSKSAWRRSTARVLLVLLELPASMHAGLFDQFEDPVDEWEGLGLVTRYDNRDNIFSPNRGHDLALIGYEVH